MKARLPIRVQLVALVLSIIVPLTGLLIYMKSEVTADDVRAASTMVLNLSDVTAASTEQFLADVQNVMSQLARRAFTHAIVPSECDAFLTDFRTLPNGFANFVIADTSGRLVCSAAPFIGVPSVEYDDRRWFQQVIQEDRFIIGDPVIGRISDKWVIPMAYPLHNASG